MAARILVVDDVALTRHLLAAMLRKMGHGVLLASDGAEALEIHHREPTDLILVDVSLPGMSGFDLVRQIRSRSDEWTPVIFISAHNTNEDVIDGLRAGGDDYLFKPVDYEILQRKMALLLDRKKMTRLIVEQNEHLQSYKERVQEEHETAEHLIRQFSAVDRIRDPQVRFHLQAAENFSGDLICVARTPDGRLHVLLADSAGHGLTAALAVIPLSQPFYQMTAKGFDIPAIVTEINRRVRDYLRLPSFVSAVLLSVDGERNLVQVWNGGCPPVLMIGERDVSVRRSFASRHLPLGVLKPEEFDDSIEYHLWGNLPGRLVLCSDGVSEIPDESGREHGLAGFLGKTGAVDQDGLFDALLDRVLEALEGGPPADDLALMMIDCRPAAEGRFEPAFEERVSACSESGKAEWTFSIILGAKQIRQMDVVPFLLGIAGQMEGRRPGGKVFLVLSELFNNALDHGLLGLDSAIKSGADGMERYFEARARRLEALEDGEIEIRIGKMECETGGMLRVHFRDTGKGFDHRKRAAVDMSANRNYHGRGIPLLRSLCRMVEYLGNGSEVVVWLEPERE